jgi:hypothetical protein
MEKMPEDRLQCKKCGSNKPRGVFDKDEDEKEMLMKIKIKIILIPPVLVESYYLLFFLGLKKT